MSIITVDSIFSVSTGRGFGLTVEGRMQPVQRVLRRRASNGCRKLRHTAKRAVGALEVEDRKSLGDYNKKPINVDLAAGGHVNQVELLTMLSLS